MGVPYKTSESPTTGRQFMVPSAPPYEEHPSGDVNKPQDDTSIDFCVANDYERRIICADKKAILESDCGLKKSMLDKSIKCVNGQYMVNSINISGFESYLRFVETNFIKFQSVDEAMDLLEICLTYSNLELLKKCISYIDFHINDSNVVKVYRFLRTYNNNINLPSPTKGSCCSSAKTHLTTADHYVAALQENCLQFIDKHSSLVFPKVEMIDLRYDELNQIISRNTLELKSELILVELLATWSWSQCEKKKLEISDDNRRRCLGALCYSPRFLAMPSKLFPVVCERIELLDDNEKNLVEMLLKGKKCSNLTTEQISMLEQFKKSRPQKGRAKPIYLSDRSHPNKSRRRGKDYYEKRSCADCFYIALCVCFG